ncbi:MAG: 4Fe-4S dicluster domain-containing protein [Nitrospirota bacterium]
MERREAIKDIGTIVAGAALAASLDLAVSTEAEAKETPEVSLPGPAPDEDVIITMQRDLLKALKKPLKDRKWSMTIDLRKCIGCHACTVGCIAENKLPPGVVYRPVSEEEIGASPNVAIRFLPRPCMQCDNPPCTVVCPVKATWKREDGIVVIDYDQCIGCRYCLVACPYGARSANSGDLYTDGTPHREAYETSPTYEYGRKRVRKSHFSSPVGNAMKCHFCSHRLDAGMLPMCVTTCVGRATYFGDVRDPDSVIAKVTFKPNAWKFKEGLGTKPSVTYLL